MNNEIKEIKRQLKYLENWLIQHQRYKIMGDLDSIFSFNLDDLQKFYDYITNLQEENDKLQGRIDKAIELLQDRNSNYDDGDFESMRFQNDIINILKGDNSNE